MEPLNFKPLVLAPSQLAQLQDVTSLNIFVSSTKNFEPLGLFSTDIFGRVGSKERNRTFGVVDLKIDVINPHIFKELVSLKGLYKDIVYGIKYAEYDETVNDFVASNIQDGNTGYSFFLKHIEKIVKGQLEEIKTKNKDVGDQRLYKLELLNIFGIKATMTRYMLISPAGMRDYTIDDNGKPSEDEVNKLYRKLIILANSLSNINVTKDNLDVYDNVRGSVQKAVQAIYDHYIDIAINGKSKFLRGRFMKRRVMTSTRNVITPLPVKIPHLGNGNNHPRLNQTAMGIYQYIKAIEPVFRNRLKTEVIYRLLDPIGNSATLVDKETLESTAVTIETKTKELWTSTAGITKLVNRIAQESIRNEPVILDNHYLLLIYDNGKGIRMIFNTSEVPEDKKRYLRPITYAELFYLVVYKVVDMYPGFTSRYPVAALGGIYPTLPYLKTTVNGRIVDTLDHNFEPDGKVYEFIKKGDAYFNSMSPHYTRLARLGADFDGDKMSFIAIMSEDGRKEILDLFKDRKFYVTPDGNITYSVSNDVLDYVSLTLSKTLEGTKS